MKASTRTPAPVAFSYKAFSLLGLTSLLLATFWCGPTHAAPIVIHKHVPTWAYDGGYGGMTDGSNAITTNSSSRRHIQTWLTFAEAGIQVNGLPQKAYYDCQEGAPCKNAVYYDPIKLFSTCWPDRNFVSQNVNEDFYLHDGEPISPANRITGSQMACGDRATYYFPNWNNPAVGRWFAQNYLWLIPENKNTIMFQDDSGAECKGRFRYEETFTPFELKANLSCEASLAMSLRTLANQIRWKDNTRVPSIVNAFGVRPTQAANTASLDLIAPGSQIIGGFEENGEIYQTKYTPRVVFGDVNTASLVYAKNPDAFYGLLATANPIPGSTNRCLDSSNNAETDCGALQLRRNMTASFWLAFKEEHTILWENFTFSGNPCCGGPHALAVYPEASIYPTSPVQALKPLDTSVETTNGSGCGQHPGSGGIQSFVVACGTLNDGTTPAGVYVREFRRCYNFGQLIGTGACAVVLNTTNRSTTIGSWFNQTYTHIMSIGSGSKNGGDVLTAGCDNGQCPTSALNPFGEAFTADRTHVEAFDAIFLFHR